MIKMMELETISEQELILGLNTYTAHTDELAENIISEIGE